MWLREREETRELVADLREQALPLRTVDDLDPLFSRGLEVRQPVARA